MKKTLLSWLTAALVVSTHLPAETGGDEAILQGLRLRSIGPAVMGGRIDDLAVVESHPWTFYLGAASGGLWKTTNNATTWTPVFDHQGTSSIGDVALAPSDPEIVWVGTGEPNNRQSSTYGDGVYRSLDGGATWRHMGLRDTHHIGRVVIHPHNPDIVYVAALGHLWGPNSERGVFKTSDGGKSWHKVLYIDEDTGVVDLAMDPVNPQFLYAASYQRRRTAWGFDGGGSGSGIHKSIDGGTTWKKLTRGLPEGILGRIGLDIYRRDPRIVYALVESREGGVFRSRDRGESWERVNRLDPRPMYYSQIRIDPNDERRIYILGAAFYVSDDGAESFRANTDMTPVYDVGVHGDHHALWIDPANSRHLILGGDGGLYVSWDGSATWDKVNNIPLAQFYDVAVDMERPYRIYGGAQDTHSWGGPSATRNHIGILNGDWFQINFGDGMYQQVDPSDSDTIYTESQGGNIVRFNRKTGDRRVIRPQPPEGEEDYRFHWTAPVLVSQHDPKTVYLGGNRLFVSEDRGETWVATEDLTRGENREELPIMGRLPDEETLSRHDGTAHWGTLTTIAESPLTPGLLWVGADDGSVRVSRDGGRTWTNLSGKFPGLDDHRAAVSRVAASHAREGRAYVSFDRHQLDDFSPYIFATDDHGESWQSISGNLPVEGWVNVVVEHPTNPNLLFAGTETGLFVTVDRGQKWIRLTGGFPTVPVDDLVIHPRDNDLVVGTHGRSIYVLDDLTPLERLTSAVLSSEVHLFDVRTAYQHLPWKHESYGGQRQFMGENPPYGAIITYYLKSVPEGDVSVSVFDVRGAAIRRLEGARRAGMNRSVWDLRVAPPEGRPRDRGPLVPPGLYTVRLEADGRQLETTFEVRPDPRLEISLDELETRFHFLMEVGRLAIEIEDGIGQTQQIIDQVGQLLEGPAKDAPEGLKNGAGKVLEQAKAIRDQLAGPEERSSYESPSLQRRVQRLYSEIDGDEVRQGTLHGPTVAQREQLDGLERRAEKELDRLQELVEKSIPELNRKIESAKLPWIRVQ